MAFPKIKTAVLAAVASIVLSATAAQAGCETARVDIEGTAWRAEVMQTKSELARGFMFREEIAPGTGMLFALQSEMVAEFWMKNTKLPLDFIFIRADGTISNIHRDGEPGSLDIIRSKDPVVAVLEIYSRDPNRAEIKSGQKVSIVCVEKRGGFKQASFSSR